MKNYEQILSFTKGTCAEGAPIIPVSAHQDINIDVLIKAMQEQQDIINDLKARIEALEN